MTRTGVTSRPGRALSPGMSALPAHLPHYALLVALVLSVLCWRVLQLLLTVLAAGFVMLVVVGMAGYGVFHLLLH